MGEIVNSTKQTSIVLFPAFLYPFRPTILSYGSYLISTFIGYPMDTIKTRFQVYNGYSSYWQCCKQTYLHEGVKGFFTGFLSPIVATAGFRSFNISVYTMVKPSIKNLLYHGNKPSNSQILANIPVTVLSGNIAGTLTALASCPFEFCKIYNQIKNVETSTKESNKMINVAKHIIRDKGVSALYSGLQYHLFRDFIGSAVYYSVYETMKPLVKHSLDNQHSDKISILLAGGLAGVCSWTVVFPIDTVKSRYQRNIVRSIVGNHQHSTKVDTKLWYRGLSLTIMRTCLTSMIFFSLFEFTMATIK